MNQEFKSYLINVDVINQGHSFVTGKTQQDAIDKALQLALAEGRINPKVVGNNIEFSAGCSF